MFKDMTSQELSEVASDFIFACITIRMKGAAWLSWIWLYFDDKLDFLFVVIYTSDNANLH